MTRADWREMGAAATLLGLTFTPFVVRMALTGRQIPLWAAGYLFFLGVVASYALWLAYTGGTRER